MPKFRALGLVQITFVRSIGQIDASWKPVLDSLDLYEKIRLQKADILDAYSVLRFMVGRQIKATDQVDVAEMLLRVR